MTRHINDLVVERDRGRSKPERTCVCKAVSYPHRVGSVQGCYGLAVCPHGLPTPEHPDYEGCQECEIDSYQDYLFDYHRDRTLGD
jgi:hypothetical protein